MAQRSVRPVSVASLPEPSRISASSASPTVSTIRASAAADIASMATMNSFCVPVRRADSMASIRMARHGATIMLAPADCASTSRGADATAPATPSRRSSIGDLPSSATAAAMRAKTAMWAAKAFLLPNTPSQTPPVPVRPNRMLAMTPMP
ncbi:hypothetical protein D9M69_632350 [compost metagenome]